MFLEFLYIYIYISGSGLLHISPLLPVLYVSRFPTPFVHFYIWNGRFALGCNLVYHNYQIELTPLRDQTRLVWMTGIQDYFCWYDKFLILLRYSLVLSLRLVCDCWYYCVGSMRGNIFLLFVKISEQIWVFALTWGDGMILHFLNVWVDEVGFFNPGVFKLSSMLFYIYLFLCLSTLWEGTFILIGGKS